MRAIKSVTICILTIGLLAGSVVRVAAQDQSSSYFTGTIDDSTATHIEGRVYGGPPHLLRGFGFLGAVVETDDERISGTLSRVANFDWSGPESETVHAGVSLWSIENEAGIWSGHGTDFGYQGGHSAEFVLLTGGGEFEGMMAILSVEPSDSLRPSDIGVSSVSGVVFKGELPPVPEMMPTAQSTAAD